MNLSVHKLASKIHRFFYLPKYNKTIGTVLYRIKLYFYWKKLPQKIAAMRSKPKIRVLFVAGGIRTWKAMPLFLSMTKHSRFEPIIGPNTNPKYPDQKAPLLSFISENGYDYIDLDTNKISDCKPDLVVYDSPYTSVYSNGIAFDKNLDNVFCGCDYCINITKHIVHLEHPWYDYCWQFYVEHEDVADRKREILGKRARNIRVTGVPIQDVLMQPKENFDDPWKDKTGKKRIIYAPHHSFKGANGDGIEFATFLQFGEVMQELAVKYQDKITIAFKPHPYLYLRLLKIWGKEKTDVYYNKWQEMSNTQFENGEYYGLFKYSDAIIHDCASFIIEYLYINNPSLYLVSESNNLDDMFDFVRDGFECYEHAKKADDIELFIQNVINGIDNKRSQRIQCINRQLLPPGGKTACDNIINSILTA